MLEKSKISCACQGLTLQMTSALTKKVTAGKTRNEKKKITFETEKGHEEQG